MNIEDLKEGDMVAAVCASCAQNHVWTLVRPSNPAKVTMQRGWKPELCTCARQTVSPNYVVCVVAEVVV